MTYTISNEHLLATFKSKGGELSSLVDLIDGVEHIFNADSNIWPWHAPILFPTIGCTVNGKLLIDGVLYDHPKHGFFRKSKPIVVEKTNTKIVFELKSDESTLAVYPYNFTFKVGYELIKNKLINWFMVENTGENDMYFMLGGHPAFKIPFYKHEQLEDYYLDFEYPETLDRQLINKNGLFDGSKRRVLNNENKLAIDAQMFDEDALVFKGLKSNSVAIRSKMHKKSIRIDFHDFPNLGIWAKPGAPFICLEPWIGSADDEGPIVELKDKKNSIRVESGKTFTAKFMLSISQH